MLSRLDKIISHARHTIAHMRSFSSNDGQWRPAFNCSPPPLPAPTLWPHMGCHWCFRALSCQWRGISCHYEWWWHWDGGPGRFGRGKNPSALPLFFGGVAVAHPGVIGSWAPSTGWQGDGSYKSLRDLYRQEDRRGDHPCSGAESTQKDVDDCSGCCHWGNLITILCFMVVLCRWMGWW